MPYITYFYLRVIITQHNFYTLYLLYLLAPRIPVPPPRLTPGLTPGCIPRRLRHVCLAPGCLPRLRHECLVRLHVARLHVVRLHVVRLHVVRLVLPRLRWILVRPLVRVVLVRRMLLYCCSKNISNGCGVVQ